MQGNDTPPAVLKTANGSLAVERLCETCGTNFLAPKVRAERGQARFCSRPCSGQSRNRHVECVCRACGATFSLKRSAVERGEGKGRGVLPPQPRPDQLARGERNGYSKLTEDLVREIRQLSANGWTQCRIAEQTMVSQTTVSRVLLRKTWHHVE